MKCCTRFIEEVTFNLSKSNTQTRASCEHMMIDSVCSTISLVIQGKVTMSSR